MNTFSYYYHIYYSYHLAIKITDIKSIKSKGGLVFMP